MRERRAARHAPARSHAASVPAGAGVVERLHADLRGNDPRVWLAPEDLKIGECFQEHSDNRSGPSTKVGGINPEPLGGMRRVKRYGKPDGAVSALNR